MARVYVGTYKKYNEGSLAGAWLDLNDFKSYDDFLRKCREVHKDETDAEFMIQDCASFPDGLSCMEWLSKQEFDDVKKAMSGEEKPNISIVDYSDKAFAVVGDTRSVKDDLKKLGGRFNGKLSCGAGWIFSNKSRDAVEKYINSGEVAKKVSFDSTPKEGQKYVDWLNELIAKENENEKGYKSWYVGAIKIDGRFCTIEKPDINNRFCFHDEGADYDFYLTLKADDNKMRQYFIDENESKFANQIERIKNGEEVFIDNYSNGRFSVCVGRTWYAGDRGRLATDEEKALILEGLRFGLSLFRKRLETYLKRYGLSKLHTWTYWADA